MRDKGNEGMVPADWRTRERKAGLAGIPGGRGAHVGI